MTIAEVSKKYGITADTIRYYEKEGLIPRIPRNKSGVRNFDENSCKWLEFIKCMRSSGLSIEVLKKYVKLMQEGPKTAKERQKLLIEQKEILLKKKETIDSTINRLEYKINLYKDIVEGKRKDFMEEP